MKNIGLLHLDVARMSFVKDNLFFLLDCLIFHETTLLMSSAQDAMVCFFRKVHDRQILMGHTLEPPFHTYI
jgi:hypothetical protein